MSYEFKVGDKVKAWGVNGVVGSLNVDGQGYPVRVEFKTPSNVFYYSFTRDGRLSEWHRTPSLKLRKFKKKLVPREIWVNVYPYDLSDPNAQPSAYTDKNRANHFHVPGRIGGKAWRYVLAKGQS